MADQKTQSTKIKRKDLDVDYNCSLMKQIEALILKNRMLRADNCDLRNRVKHLDDSIEAKIAVAPELGSGICAKMLRFHGSKL